MSDFDSGTDRIPILPELPSVLHSYLIFLSKYSGLQFHRNPMVLSTQISQTQIWRHKFSHKLPVILKSDMICKTGFLLLVVKGNTQAGKVHYGLFMLVIRATWKFCLQYLWDKRQRWDVISDLIPTLEFPRGLEYPSITFITLKINFIQVNNTKY